MPGAPRLRHELEHAPVLEDEVVGGDLRDRVAEPLQGLALVRHAGVVQDQHVGPAAVLALAVVGRGEDLRGDRAVRREARLMRVTQVPLARRSGPRRR